MQKWEYKIVDTAVADSEAERLLNELGEQGWELMFILNARCYLKRLKS